MLSIRRRRNEAALIERYWSSLRRDRATQAPDALDPTIANVINEVERELRPPRLSEPSIEQLWRRVDARASETSRSGWSGPAIDPSIRRQTGAPLPNEREEQHVMSDHTQTADIEPIPIQQRRWFRETLKFVAAALVFIVIGAVLALTLRDDQNEPAIGPPTIPSPTSTPTVLATPSAAVVAPTQTTERLPTATRPAATATPETSPTPSLPVAGEVVARIEVGENPFGLAAGAGAIWVANGNAGTVSRIDPATNQVVATITIPNALGPGAPDLSPSAIAVFGEQVWVINDAMATLVRIDPATNQVVETIPLPGAGSYTLRGLTAGAGSLWVSDPYFPRLLRIDPATGSVIAEISELGPYRVVATDDAVWVGDLYASGELVRIDPATNQVVASTSAGAGLTGIDVGADSVWVGAPLGNRVSRVDPATNEVIATVDDVAHANGVAFDASGVWVTGDLLYRIDPATNQVVGALPLSVSQSIIAADGSIWVIIEAENTVLRIDPAP